MSNKQRRVTFGKWLKSRREAAHLTQMDLARMLNYENPQIISNIERGFSALPARRVYDFAGLLNCNGLELELRRVHSSAKDDECANALEAVITHIPFVNEIRAENLTAMEAIHAVNRFRALHSLKPTESGSIHAMESEKAPAGV